MSPGIFKGRAGSTTARPTIENACPIYQPLHYLVRKALDGHQPAILPRAPCHVSLRPPFQLLLPGLPVRDKHSVSGLRLPFSLDPAYRRLPPRLRGGRLSHSSIPPQACYYPQQEQQYSEADKNFRQAHSRSTYTTGASVIPAVFAR